MNFIVFFVCNYNIILHLTFCGMCDSDRTPRSGHIFTWTPGRFGSGFCFNKHGQSIIYLDPFSWLEKAYLVAFSCSLANLFSYLETFLRVGLMNLPFMSLTLMVSSLICRSLRMTSLCRKNISPSRLYHLSKYCWQIFLRSSVLALSRSALVPHLSAMTLSLSSAFLSCSNLISWAAFFLRRVRSFFLRSGVMKAFCLPMMLFDR